MKPDVVLATRGSALARAQAEEARGFVEKAFCGTKATISIFATAGDRQMQWTLAAHGGKGLFTKELEDALLDGRADLAVHSAKDLPTELPDGLAIAGFLPREDVCDVFIRRTGCNSPRVIASGSPRRREQGAMIWPDAEWTEIRGNVETRLRKVAEGKADATILASAGLKRLGIAGYDGIAFEPVSVEKMVPAAGQAAIAVECRAADLSIYTPVFDAETSLEVGVERMVLAALGGGCNSASAAYFDGLTLRIHAAGKGIFAVPFAVASIDEARGKLKSVLETIARGK
jgi:hydroxymethylbilane synthase